VKTCDVCSHPTRNRKRADELLLCTACRTRPARLKALDRRHDGECLEALLVAAKPRATDLLLRLPHWTDFVIARATEPKTQRLVAEARWDAVHIVRSGLRDYLDQLEDPAREETSS
jgi:hypothetical protein